MECPNKGNASVMLLIFDYPISYMEINQKNINKYLLKTFLYKTLVLICEEKIVKPNFHNFSVLKQIIAKKLKKIFLIKKQ